MQHSKGVITGMADIDIIKTEVVWLGKYDEGDTLKGVSSISLPFRIVETAKDQT